VVLLAILIIVTSVILTVYSAKAVSLDQKYHVKFLFNLERIILICRYLAFTSGQIIPITPVYIDFKWTFPSLIQLPIKNICHADSEDGTSTRTKPLSELVYDAIRVKLY